MSTLKTPQIRDDVSSSTDPKSAANKTSQKQDLRAFFSKAQCAGPYVTTHKPGALAFLQRPRNN